MNNINERFSKLGIHIPEILLPDNVDMNKWAVIACDQFTSECEYWEKTYKHVEDGPSTLNLILPECYLDHKDKNSKIENIKSTMKNYIEKKILKELEPGFILVDRSTEFTPSRKGLIIAIDLEHYSFEKENKSLIRPTEGTVLERLPPRIEIRENATLDIPHILLLINDKEKIVIEEAFKNIEKLQKVYDFTLMHNGGRIKGHLVKEEKYLSDICDAFEKLTHNKDLLFAVGDGNHSLASAKKIWDKLKKDGADINHPARYALVEVNNIYNDGVIFEPIHRVLFNINKDNFLNKIKRDTKAQIINNITEEEVKKQLSLDHKEHVVGFLYNKKWGLLKIDDPEKSLSYEVIQKEIDDYLVNNSIKIDYIHGDKTVKELGQKDNNLVLYFPPISKKEFFSLIEEKGSLPRKTFSIGEAEEKRYYIESRKIGS